MRLNKLKKNNSIVILVVGITFWSAISCNVPRREIEEDLVFHTYRASNEGLFKGIIYNHAHGSGFVFWGDFALNDNSIFLRHVIYKINWTKNEMIAKAWDDNYNFAVIHFSGKIILENEEGKPKHIILEKIYSLEFVSDKKFNKIQKRARKKLEKQMKD